MSSPEIVGKKHSFGKFGGGETYPKPDNQKIKIIKNNKARPSSNSYSNLGGGGWGLPCNLKKKVLLKVRYATFFFLSSRHLTYFERVLIGNRSLQLTTKEEFYYLLKCYAIISVKKWDCISKYWIQYDLFAFLILI